MDSKQEDKIKHIYDGIVENDNPMPRWWLATFVICVVFAVVYYVLFTGYGKLTIEEEYLTRLSAHRALVDKASREAEAKLLAGMPIAKRIEALAGDTSAVSAGKAVYTERCAMCHGPEGQGLVGPNLTDNHWIHGDGGPDVLFRTISEGVNNKGMPPWKTVLTIDQVLQVAAFVKTLKGTRPPNPKAPEGVEQKL